MYTSGHAYLLDRILQQECNVSRPCKLNMYLNTRHIRPIYVEITNECNLNSDYINRKVD